MVAATLLAGTAVAAAVAGRAVVASIFPFVGAPARPDLILHTVKRELLPVTVVERGTLESADNKELVCRVKSGSRGGYSSTIKWVIDDGTQVVEGQLLIDLDDSALQDLHRAQTIAVEKAKAEWVKADEDYTITIKQNQSDIATAEAALKVAELDLDKYVGVRVDPELNPLGALTGGPATLTERGEYRQKLDDVSGRLKLAESDLESYRDRSSWAERSVKLGYLTASQAKVEQSKLAGADDNVEKLRKEKYILETFLRKRDLTDLASKLEVAALGLDRAERQARAKENQAESTRRTAYAVYQQELEKQKDIDEQLRQCKLYAPQDGMVVYYRPESSRYGGSSTTGIVQAGNQVYEGQKLMRIPDLKRMQVNTRVHEAMVSRIRGDDRQSTGYMDGLRAGLLAGPHAFTRLVNHSEHAMNTLREMSRDQEYRLASHGQKATIRIDAFPDRPLAGHVRTVAAVASQADFMASDVKVYQTLVTIDESLDGLKPDMSAEVTIQVDPPKDPVLAVPIQAVVGGAEGGVKRKLFVATPAGAAERDVTLGAFNDKMVEVREGLQEGDRVVLNPKVLLGDSKQKTREEAPANGGRPAMGGGEKGKGGKGGPGGKGGGSKQQMQ